MFNDFHRCRPDQTCESAVLPEEPSDSMESMVSIICTIGDPKEAISANGPPLGRIPSICKTSDPLEADILNFEDSSPKDLGSPELPKQ